MSKCPKCNAEIGMKAWIPSKWHYLNCPSCGVRLKPNRFINILGFIIGPGFAIVVGLPLLTGGHPIWGALICIFCPALGIWLITEHNRFKIIDKESTKESDTTK